MTSEGGHLMQYDPVQTVAGLKLLLLQPGVSNGYVYKATLIPSDWVIPVTASCGLLGGVGGARAHCALEGLDARTGCIEDRSIAEHVAPELAFQQPSPNLVGILGMVTPHHP